MSALGVVIVGTVFGVNKTEVPFDCEEQIADLGDNVDVLKYVFKASPNAKL